MKVGIIDLGTNSARLFIYEQNKKGRFRKTLKTKTMVRLGDGLFENGELSPDAIERTAETIVDFGDILKSEKPDLIRAVATSALREAPNPNRLISPVNKATGITIEVIPGEEEARLIAVGVLRNVKLPDHPCVLIDIGGGSTEISVLIDKKIAVSRSLELGAGRNQQTFLCTVPPIRGQKGKGMRALREHVRNTLSTNIPKEFQIETPMAIGTSGSLRAFRRIANNLGEKGPSFSVSLLKEIVDELKGKSRDEILSSFPTLEPRRADLILAAGIIMQECCSFFEVKTIHVTSSSLKDGILANLQMRYHI